MLFEPKWCNTSWRGICSLTIKRKCSLNFLQPPINYQFYHKISVCTISAYATQDNISSIFSGAWHTSRGKKDLKQRTFEEAKMWEDPSYTYYEVWHALERNSDYWLGNPLPHTPRITFECIFKRLFCHIQVMHQRHALQTDKKRMFSYGYWLLKVVGEYKRRKKKRSFQVSNLKE